MPEVTRPGSYLRKFVMADLTEELQARNDGYWEGVEDAIESALKYWQMQIAQMREEIRTASPPTEVLGEPQRAAGRVIEGKEL